MPDHSPNEEDIKKLESAQNQFILEWGRMSSSWGINRTMAQIHALLIATDAPQSMDHIIDRLGISRGNASMSLRDLMEWGVVQRFRKAGERKDFYVTDQDPLQIFARVLKERKRRELDPTKVAIHDCLSRAPSAEDYPEAKNFRERLEGLLKIFTIMDVLFDQMFKTEESVHEAFAALEQIANLQQDTSIFESIPRKLERSDEESRQ
jgi:DNA-binding transcriptional regulator GbsR (MarR family)